MTKLSIFAPAKINLFLAVTGRRADGFHDLVSLVAPLDFGDTLTVEAGSERRDPPAAFALATDDPALACDDSNLVLKAARAFAHATGWRRTAQFFLEKRIPVGAGLGGGSSDAVAALRALNELAGAPLTPSALAALAAQLGSDCPLFLAGGPAVIRGRGERVAALPAAAAARLRGRRVLLFKPGFGVPTPWAYARLAAEPAASYLAADAAEARLAGWLDDPAADVAGLLFNNMERAVFAKFPALPVLLEQLRARFGLAARLSGSGSACFAFVADGEPLDPIVAAIRSAWGGATSVIEARLR